MAVDLETFKTVAKSLARLMSDGPVALRVVKPFTPTAIDFDIHFRDLPVVEALSETGLSRQKYRDGIEDLEEVLTSLVQETPLEREVDEENSEQAEVTQEKRACASELFDISALKERAWIKETTKCDIFLDASWEASLKTLDETKKPPNDQAVPAGLLRIKGSSLDTPFSFLSGADTTELLLTMDRADIKAIAETLRRLDEELVRLEESLGGAN